MLGCGANSQATRGNPADRTRGGEKCPCCVTTRRRNFWVFNGMGRSLRPLTASALCLGVAGFGTGILAMLGLSPRRLPAADLPLAFRVLAVALVPTPRLVLSSTPFAQANPWPWSAPSGPMAALPLNVIGAHGRCFSQGKELGEDVSPFSPSYPNTNEALARQSTAFQEQDRERNGFKNAIRRRRQDR